MKAVLVLFALAASSNGLPSLRQRLDSSPDFFELPSNASRVLGEIRTGFDCSALPYGYYADTANACRIYHVCLPYINFGQVITRQFSFMCGEGLMFDQEKLTCDYPQNALPCELAESFRTSNEYFGRFERNFLE